MPTDTLILELEFWELATDDLRNVSPDPEERERRFMTRPEYIAYGDDEEALSEAEIIPEEKLENDLILEVSSQVLKTMGLIDVSVDLLQEFDQLTDEFVGGFYDRRTRILTVVLDEKQGMFKANDIRIYVHEYLHFLQDSEFNVFEETDEDAVADSEADQAFSALIEGEAEYFAQLVLARTRGGEYLQSVFETEEPAEGSEPVEEEDFPYYLVQAFSFPYSAGTAFINAALLPSTINPQPTSLADVDENFAGWSLRLNELHELPPTTTEQVLHYEKYLEGELALEVDIATPEELLAKGWTEIDRDRWGEFGLQLWLESLTAEVSEPDADTTDAVERAAIAAAGWGGDQIIFMKSSCEETASLTRIEWDEPGTDADEFNSELISLIGTDERFSLTDSVSDAVDVYSGPLGFLAMPQDDSIEVTIVVTSQSSATAEALVLWMLGEADLTDACAA